MRVYILHIFNVPRFSCLPFTHSDFTKTDLCDNDNRGLFTHRLVDRSTNWSTNSSTGRPKYWVATVVSGIGNNEFESCLRIFSWIFIYLRLAELRGKRAITILTGWGELVSFKHALREGLKKKSKNMMEFSIIGLTPPLPLWWKISQSRVSQEDPPKVKKFLMHFCII